MVQIQRTHEGELRRRTWVFEFREVSDKLRMRLRSYSEERGRKAGRGLRWKEVEAYRACRMPWKGWGKSTIGRERVPFLDEMADSARRHLAWWAAEAKLEGGTDD